ncbi:abortive infection family protein [Pseudoalteromonas sp. TAB23]|uniref:abortive infection family protein n=1 Tax=Pseudoalteromonas sp. TAB23 TaxID=1938595 RepID=UPI000405E32E|nr:abortive infection family protein [Pseudoalteromonas sp. TAB23]
MDYVIFSRTKYVVDKTADRYKLARTLLAAEAAYNEKETGLVIGHAKALVEGICKSILDEYKKEYAGDIAVGKLAKKAVSVFEIGKGLKNEKKVIEAFKKIINSSAAHFEAAIQGVGELRNDFCPLAHGRSLDHVPLDLHYAEFIARQADSIIGFIYDLRESFISAEPEILPVRDHDFDTFLNDEFESVQIYEDIYLPSEILFNVNPIEYMKVFNEREESLEEVEP